MLLLVPADSGQRGWQCGGLNAGPLGSLLQADLHPYFPYLHVTAVADVVVFQPLVGMHLGEAERAQGMTSCTRLQAQASSCNGRCCFGQQGHAQLPHGSQQARALSLLEHCWSSGASGGCTRYASPCSGPSTGRSSGATMALWC